MAPDSLEEKHHFNFRDAVHVFSTTKKMGGQEFCDRYQAQLETELGEMWLSFMKHNQVRNHRFTGFSFLLSFFVELLTFLKRERIPCTPFAFLFNVFNFKVLCFNYCCFLFLHIVKERLQRIPDACRAVCPCVLPVRAVGHLTLHWSDEFRAGV